MDLVLYGLNHTTAPIEIREQLSFKVDDASRIMDGLRSTGIFIENLLLSTCNRTEIYGLSETAGDSVRKLQDVLAKSVSFEPGILSDHSYLHLNAKAVNHLFRVSAGIDSMVIGEVEILGQIKDAYRTATGIDATGPYLNKLFHHCFRVGKRVRNETAISAGGISVGSSAVELARKVLGKLDEKTALLIGAGDTGQLVARHLVQAGVDELVVTNRTALKAEELASSLGGSTLPFDEYPSQVSKFNLVVSAVGADEHTITRRMLKRRRGMFPLLIDLGVPRDIEPAIDRMSGAIVYHIDDLQAFVREQTARREKEIPKVERIVSEETARFIGWSDSLRAQRTIEDLRVKFEELRTGMLDKWEGRLNPKEQKLADRITTELVKKILHEPTVNLKGCELEDGAKKCELCEMFEEGRGCIHGHLNQEVKCIITRNLFGLQDPSAAEEIMKWRNSDDDNGGEVDG
jgi:glutamyl-tRNA reductase